MKGRKLWIEHPDVMPIRMIAKFVVTVDLLNITPAQDVRSLKRFPHARSPTQAFEYGIEKIGRISAAEQR